MRNKQGTQARVIDGALTKSNVGMIVTIEKYIGDHSKYGAIWHCRSENHDLITEYGAVGNQADFADDWLEPIEPEQLKDTTKEEMTA